MDAALEEQYKAALPHYRKMREVSNGGRPLDQPKEWREAHSEIARLLGGTKSTHPECSLSYTITLGPLTAFERWAADQISTEKAGDTSLS